MIDRTILIFIISIISFFACDTDTDIEADLYSNVDDIEEFGIYLLADSITYNSIIADTTTINVIPEPFISTDEIDYYEVTSHSIHFMEPLNLAGFDRKPYVIIANGKILAIGTFYSTFNCCYPLSSNSLIIPGFIGPHKHIMVNEDQRITIQNYLPADKIRKAIDVNFKDFKMLSEDSVNIEIDFINKLNEAIYLLDPAKTPELYALGHRNDIFYGVREIAFPESFMQAYFPRKFADDNYTLVQPMDSLSISLDQRAISWSSFAPLETGKTYEVRFYYNNASEEATLNAIWQNIIIHSQEVTAK